MADCPFLRLFRRFRRVFNSSTCPTITTKYDLYLFYRKEDLDYEKVGSLRIEARQKLELYRPISIGQASRISGVSPADISVLLVYLEQYRRNS